MTQRALPVYPVDWPTVWGLNPVEIHDRFWASRGVQVVRPADAAFEPDTAFEPAELYLLTTTDQLFLFPLRRFVDTLRWLESKLLFIKLIDESERGCREAVVTDDALQLRNFQRIYDGPDADVAGVALTPDTDLARLWRSAADPTTGLRALLSRTSPSRRSKVTGTARIYNTRDDREVMRFTRDVVQAWKRPDSTVRRATKVAGDVWADSAAQVSNGSRVVGPVWVGAGRHIDGEEGVVGPAVLWDDPGRRPAVDKLRWETLSLAALRDDLGSGKKKAHRSAAWSGKRAFDIVFSLIGLSITLPFYPFIMLAIFVRDGRPFFFSHRRQTLGGREFPCIKFRTMCKDAEKMKASLKTENEADGPQFFMDKDPRLTPVGRLLRKTKIDEFPQFFNVLLGHMSVVGPRPSPHVENQYCPDWRNARLSVRPGITGLWQVMRTRRQGADFQEWVKYDIEYAQNATWRLDFRILWRTLAVMIRDTVRKH